MGLEEELLEKFTSEELEKKIDEYYEKFHGFLTKPAALRLIAKDAGLEKKEVKEITLATVEPGMRNLKLKATIAKIMQTQTTQKGNTYRVVQIKDSTGTHELVLWGKDIQAYQSLRAGDEITIENAYEKLGRISLSYAGAIHITKKSSITPLASLSANASFHVEGKIARILEAEDHSINFVLQDASGERTVHIEKDPTRVSRIAVQKELMLENAYFDGEILHVTEESRFLIKRTDGVSGLLKDLVPEENSLKIILEKGEFSLLRNEALQTLGIQVQDDITLATVASLVKDSRIGRPIFVKTLLQRQTKAN